MDCFSSRSLADSVLARAYSTAYGGIYLRPAQGPYFLDLQLSEG